MCDYVIIVVGFDLQWIVVVMFFGMFQVFNVCVECCDWYVLLGWIVLFWEGKDGSCVSYIFSELKVFFGCFVNFFQVQGVCLGDCVVGLLLCMFEFLVIIFGVWCLGVVYQLLFIVFGLKVIEYCVVIVGSKVLVIDVVNCDKFDEFVDLFLVVIVGGLKGQGICCGDFSFWVELECYLVEFELVLCSGEDLFLMMFIFGIIGLVKLVLVLFKVIFVFVGYLCEVVDLCFEDVFWNFVDLGWVYGFYYVVVGFFVMGYLIIFYEGLFSVESICWIICDYGIINFVGLFIVYCLLMVVGVVVEIVLKGCLCVVSSVGELLILEVICWFVDRFGIIIYDYYGQIELGMVLCNYYVLVYLVWVGVVGFVCFGYWVVVLDDDFNELLFGQLGIFVFDWWCLLLMWFFGYQGLEIVVFVGDYYLSGDIVEFNEDGSISFVGCVDDVIIIFGYWVGLFDVESVLIEYLVVMEVVVIGKFDLECIELVKVFVVFCVGYWLMLELVDVLQ